MATAKLRLKFTMSDALLLMSLSRLFQRVITHSLLTPIFGNMG